MKNVLKILTLLLMAAYTFASMPLYAEEPPVKEPPLLDPDAPKDPPGRTGGGAIFEGFGVNSTLLNPVRFEQSADILTVIFTMDCGVVTLNVTNSAGDVISTMTINSSTTPHVELFFGNWVAGTYTIRIGNKSCVVSVN